MAENSDPTKGALIRARRKQQRMSRKYLAALIDVTVDQLIALEERNQELPPPFMRALASNLCLTERYLLGTQTLAEAMKMDYCETEIIIETFTVQIRALPYQALKRTVADQIARMGEFELIED